MNEIVAFVEITRMNYNSSWRCCLWQNSQVSKILSRRVTSIKGGITSPSFHITLSYFVTVYFYTVVTVGIQKVKYRLCWVASVRKEETKSELAVLWCWEVGTNLLYGFFTQKTCKRREAKMGLVIHFFLSVLQYLFFSSLNIVHMRVWCKLTTLSSTEI